VFRRRPGLLSVYLLYFAANALLYSIVVFYPQLLSSVGITSSLSISLYLAANGAAGGVAAALYDRLVARTGRHALVAVAVGLWTVAFAAATLAGSALTAVPAVVAFGLGQGLVFPASFAWIEALAPRARQGQFSSYLASAGYTGQFVSPVLFGPLVPLFGVRGVFGAAAALAAVGGLALAVALGRRRSRGVTGERDRRTVPDASGEGGRVLFRSRRKRGVSLPPVGLGTMGIDDREPTAATRETTPEAVALTWATAKEPVVTIPKASSERHLRANLAAADIDLTDEATAAIDAVEREKELVPE